jgi:LAT3 family solute carrier family 43 protein 3
MSLSKSKKEWVKYMMVIWAFFECLFFAGTLYGWSSLVFVFKDEGIYSNLCDTSLNNMTSSDFGLDSNTTRNAMIYNSGDNVLDNITVIDATNAADINNLTVFYKTNISGEMSDTVKNERVQCKEQDSMLSLCFTISSSIFCISCVVMGQVNYKLGTRITRYIAL